MRNVAIHGFGRIGRSALKAALKEGYLYPFHSRILRTLLHWQPFLKSTPITVVGTKM